MKSKNKQELDVDFIGVAEPLTKEEEKRISAFLKVRKQKALEQKRSIQHEKTLK